MKMSRTLSVSLLFLTAIQSASVQAVDWHMIFSSGFTALSGLFCFSAYRHARRVKTGVLGAAAAVNKDPRMDELLAVIAPDDANDGNYHVLGDMAAYHKMRPTRRQARAAAAAQRATDEDGRHQSLVNAIKARPSVEELAALDVKFSQEIKILSEEVVKLGARVNTQEASIAELNEQMKNTATKAALDALEAKLMARTGALEDRFAVIAAIHEKDSHNAIPKNRHRA